MAGNADTHLKLPQPVADHFHPWSWRVRDNSHPDLTSGVGDSNREAGITASNQEAGEGAPKLSLLPTDRTQKVTSFSVILDKDIHPVPPPQVLG